MNKKLLLFLFLFPCLFTSAQDLTISGGSRHSLAVDEEGKVYAWGANNFGQLADRNMDMISYPVPVTFPEDVTITKVDAGAGDHNLAVDCNGNLWAWGQNDDGQVGNGEGGRSLYEFQSGVTGNYVFSPQRVLKGEQSLEDGASTDSPYLSDVKYISGGHFASYAIVGEDRALMAWGSNISGLLNSMTPEIVGLLGNNNPNSEFSNTPVYVRDGNGEILRNVVTVDAGVNTIFALTEDGQVYSFGANENGLLGIGENPNFQRSLSAVKVRKGEFYQGDSGDLNNVVQISTGLMHALAIDSAGNTWGWGASWAGQLGRTESEILYAIKVPTGVANQFLTNATFASASQIGSAVVVSEQVKGGKTKGYLYTFGGSGSFPNEDEEPGDQLYGQLGNSNPPFESAYNPFNNTPTLVDAFVDGGTTYSAEEMNVIAVSDGSGVFYVTTVDPGTNKHSVWVMGANNKGQLGLGHFNQRLVATKLPSLGESDVMEICPTARISHANFKRCNGVRDTLFAGALGTTYNYNWSKVTEEGSTTLSSTEEDASVLVTNGDPGVYVVEIIKTGNCSGSCPSSRDTIVFEDNSINKEESLYGNDSATYVFTDDYYPEMNGIYSFYETETSEAPLRGKFERIEDTVKFTVATDETLLLGDELRAVYLEDDTYTKTSLLEEIPCSQNIIQRPVDNYYSKITVYEDVRLDSIRAYVSSMYGTQELSFNVNIYGSRNNNNALVPDEGNILYTGTTPTYSVGNTMDSVYVSIDAEIEGSRDGKTVWLQLEPIGNNVINFIAECPEAAYPFYNQTGTVVLSGYSEFGNEPSVARAIPFSNYHFTSLNPCPGSRIELRAARDNGLVTSLDNSKKGTKIEVFPNPASSNITVKSENFEKAIITDAAGKALQIYYSPFINIENYETGIYYLKVYTKGEVEILKVFKK